MRKENRAESLTAPVSLMQLQYFAYLFFLKRECWQNSFKERINHIVVLSLCMRKERFQPLPHYFLKTSHSRLFKRSLKEFTTITQKSPYICVRFTPLSFISLSFHFTLTGFSSVIFELWISWIIWRNQDIQVTMGLFLHAWHIYGLNILGRFFL